MRIPKAFLINGILLVICIASWTVFLRQNSPERRKADAEALASTFLGHYLPPTIQHVDFTVEDSSGQRIEVFPRMEGRRLAEPEFRQIEMQTQLSIQLYSARQTPQTAGWKRIGEIHLPVTDGTRGSTIEVFETPSLALGFRREGVSYLAEGASQPLIDYLRVRRAAAPRHD